MKDNSVFNPNQQQNDLSSKIVTGLERISEVFKILLWEKSKVVGLSPIQIQILIFIAFHKESLCSVSHLAKEFNVTKPTVSDAIKILDKKALIVKVFSSSDQRRYTIQLSALGEAMVSEIHDFAHPLKSQIDNFSPPDLEAIFQTISTLIYKLNRSGILTVQRTCFACKFYEKNGAVHYCNLLEKELVTNSIRLDCPEFVAKPVS
ncbi:MarR family winged helix-turn-helix transcriptional regulator [Psychroserpens sp. SPM9]|uniref:MarR family winged helix-turn-helix transcriptional regulator n=1 Tax=Psychroserpens sp. SPM9 TaxID=2975598 RepID=UPI0021A924D8|nr:MarR family winged helix-turn-helix transcriptional regulator [Psychroserpens sp. SPM9]MDG5492212.1 MarR family winged helix-turn-helix transcriptional regulator [Psychroserpens sp. SPM9]